LLSTILAAATAVVFVVTRDQQKSMLVTIGERSEATDFSALVDEERFIQCQIGTLRHKTVQVQSLAVLPKNGVFDRVGAGWEEGGGVKTRSTNNLAHRIDSIRGTARIAWQGTEVRNHAMFPEECE
jgi:hypothetical protein